MIVKDVNESKYPSDFKEETFGFPGARINGHTFLNPATATNVYDFNRDGYVRRLVDGKEAVTFLVRIKEALEDPQRAILDL